MTSVISGESTALGGLGGPPLCTASAATRRAAVTKARRYARYARICVTVRWCRTRLVLRLGLGLGLGFGLVAVAVAVALAVALADGIFLLVYSGRKNIEQ
jgi:hypothetical protein